MEKTNNLKVGDIVQLNPDDTHNPMFRGCLMIVTKLKDFGAQGYVQALGEFMQPGGQAYYRAKWEEMEWVGHAHWIVGGDECPD